jgi:cysteinyl-tRNA synthetase
MSLHLYNTLTGKKEKFVSIKPNEVKIYLCGPTVYDLLHIGNFRGAIVFNLLRQWLKASGYKVTFVYNYTDVDDKILNRAVAENVDPKVISEKYIAEFEKDFNRLGLEKHDYNPRVTEYMKDIIEMVEKLIENKKAYLVENEVIFSIDNFPEYGKLSKKNLEELDAGNRVDVDNRKKNPLDFVLWKPAKAGEPSSWDSPWGKGRPGWHIECSAMIKSLLGETIDIHGGGIDLIFPHHENEIAQGEGCSGHKYCNYWVHNNFMNMKDQKMSKSLGNVITGRSFMDKYHAEILKFLYLSAHYRSILSLTDEKIEQVIAGLSRFYSALQIADQVLKNSNEVANPESGLVKKFTELDQKIKKSLDDDLNSTEMISHLFDGVRYFNSLNYKNKKVTGIIRANAEYFKNWLIKYGKMSALFLEEPTSFLEELDQILIRNKNIPMEKVFELLKQREEARANKDWAKADIVRDQLLLLGIELQDGQGKGWTVKKISE